MDATCGMSGEVRERRKEAGRELQKIYNKIGKKYGLWKREYSSIYENRDDLIEIWRFEGGKKKYICRVKRKSIEECYEIAVLDLKFFEERMRAAEAGSRA